MRYLITGGAGFIGCHLAERLLSAGHAVTVIRRSLHRLDPKYRATESTGAGFSYVVESIFNRPLLAELIDDCDAVFHLAASVGVRLIVESPVRTIETNVKGTEVVLEFARQEEKESADRQHLGGLRQVDQDSVL